MAELSSRVTLAADLRCASLLYAAVALSIFTVSCSCGAVRQSSPPDPHSPTSTVPEERADSSPEDRGGIDSDGQNVARQILIQYKPGVTERAKESVRTEAGVAVWKRVMTPQERERGIDTGLEVVVPTPSNSKPLRVTLSKIETSPSVDYAEFNHVWKLSEPDPRPNDAKPK